MHPWYKTVAMAIVVLSLVAACRKIAPAATTLVPPAPTATSAPTSTPTATATTPPIPTATATPTALPATVLGDPRQARLSTPSPQSGAPCGVVDLLDFPLDPPDGNRARGGSDFGVYREHYNGIHTGEDWWWGAGNQSAGKPVYSIGHGVVTYAQPRGWGRDGGTVIVRHTFPDGSTILSFYGHLNPPSVILRAGDCVARGDQVGQIGRPPYPDHLHFEIRSHMPSVPGPGYWSVDPTLAGWEPPSQYIWNERIVPSPGVQWLRSFTSRFRQGLGILDDDTLVAIDDLQLIGIDASRGSFRWSWPISDTTFKALLDTDRAVVYLASQLCRIEAFRLPDPASSASPPYPALLWTIKLDAVGTSALMPLPGGGVVLHAYHQLFGVSAGGELLWKLDSMTPPLSWTLEGDRLIVATNGEDASVWTIDHSGPMAWAARIGGRPLVAGGQIFMYSTDGIYRLNPETRSAELLYALPRAYPGLGDMVALPDGGVLVAHPDRADRRLIALNGDGTLRWQRSYANAGQGKPRLLAVEGRVYLLLQNDISYSGSFDAAASTTDIFWLDTGGEQLTRIFAGGTRNLQPEDTWAFALDAGHLLFSVGGGTMVGLDTQLAIEAVSQAANAP